MTINWEVIIWTCITLAVLMSVIGLILYAISARNVRQKAGADIPKDIRSRCDFR